MSSIVTSVARFFTCTLDPVVKGVFFALGSLLWLVEPKDLELQVRVVQHRQGKNGECSKGLGVQWAHEPSVKKVGAIASQDQNLERLRIYIVCGAILCPSWLPDGNMNLFRHKRTWTEGRLS